MLNPINAPPGVSDNLIVVETGIFAMFFHCFLRSFCFLGRQSVHGQSTIWALMKTIARGKERHIVLS